MNQYNPFQFYAGMAQPDSAKRREQLVQSLQAKMMGQPAPQNVGEGIGAVMTGIATGVAKRNAAFPVAPGGAKPSLMTGLANFFGAGRSGGLY